MHGDHTPDESIQRVSPDSQRFRFLKQFNSSEFAHKIKSRDRLIPEDVRWFPGDNLISAFAQALCAQRAMPFKEVLESFEFFGCVRKRIRSESVADLCCGHGLVGVLFAMFERSVERVVLLDKIRPSSFDRVCSAADEVAPWTTGKLTYVKSTLRDAKRHLEPKMAMVGVHACGTRTDQCLELAIESGGAVGVLPCCHRHRHESPECLKRALGPDVAIDVDRTYRLAAAGYKTRWDRIPEPITQKNRVLIGVPPV